MHIIIERQMEIMKGDIWEGFEGKLELELCLEDICAF